MALKLTQTDQTSRQTSRQTSVGQMAVVGGQYQLLQEVGRGTMGVVYRAQDLSTGRTVCVKLLPPDCPAVAVETERMRATFQRMQGIKSPYLCSHFAFGIDEAAGPFLVMKYARGCSLAKLCEPTLGVCPETHRTWN